MKNIDLNKLEKAIRDVPDFPKPGIVFKDITPVLADAELFSMSIQAMASTANGAGTVSYTHLTLPTIYSV